MKSEYLDYIRDILNAMDKASSFVGTQKKEDFLTDDKTVFAVVRALEIIGEAVKRVPEEVRETYSHIPWRAMAGMRDRLIHGYDEVNLDLVWQTVKTQIPELKSEFEQILSDHKL